MRVRTIFKIIIICVCTNWGSITASGISAVYF